MKLWQRIIAVGLGGFVGGSLRELIELAIKTPFPWATILINIVGTFLSVLMVSLLGRVIKLPQLIVDFIIIGILGAFTTFSSAELDMLKVGQLRGAMLYFIVSLVGGVIVVLLARRMTRRVVR